jgi:hypothetical protein
MNKLINLFIKYPNTYYNLELELNKMEKIKNKIAFREYKYRN